MSTKFGFVIFGQELTHSKIEIFIMSHIPASLIFVFFREKSQHVKEQIKNASQNKFVKHFL